MIETKEFRVTLPMSEYIEGYRMDRDIFLGYCRECRNFGRSWACPPFDVDIPLDTYSYANILGLKIVVDPVDRECKMTPEQLKQAISTLLRPFRIELDARMLKIEKSIQGSRALFAGSCVSCAEGECSRAQGIPCLKPEQMRPSLEALGFDVGRTTSELLSVELQWSRESLPEYFTLVSALFANTPVTI